MNTAPDPDSNDINQAVAGYVDYGYGMIKGLLSQVEVDRLVQESDRLWHQYAGTGSGNLRLGLRTDRSGNTVIDRIDPVADISEVFAEVNSDQRFVSIAETGLGEPVTVMKEKLIYRWPGTRGFGPHRDQSYTTPRSGVPGEEVLTICISLDRAIRAAGPMEFFPGLRDRETSAPADEPRDVDERELTGLDSCKPETEPGDVILFDGKIPHRSDWNQSDRCRRVFMISYVPARHPDARQNYYAARNSEERAIRQHFLEGSSFFE